MADDDTNDHDHEVHAFSFPLPPHMAELVDGQRERRQMSAQAAETDVSHLLDSLDVDQLLALRRMLCCDYESSSNNYFDGQIVTLLRVVHKVDIATGKRFDDALDELISPPPAPTAD